jgi:hypothetical protein
MGWCEVLADLLGRCAKKSRVIMNRVEQVEKSKPKLYS